MLDSMAGKTTGVRDALTFFTRPITGAYYFFATFFVGRQLARFIHCCDGIGIFEVAD